MHFFAEVFFAEALEVKLECRKPPACLTPLCLATLGGPAAVYPDSEMHNSVSLRELSLSTRAEMSLSDSLLPDNFPISLLRFSAGLGWGDEGELLKDGDEQCDSVSAGTFEDLVDAFPDLPPMYSPTSPLPEGDGDPGGSLAETAVVAGPCSAQGLPVP